MFITNINYKNLGFRAYFKDTTYYINQNRIVVFDGY